jgi:hypothetical protein
MCPCCHWCAAGINEQQLFHGSEDAAVAAITLEGFDCRCCQVGAWGNGTYFADSSCGALSYSKRKQAYASATSTAGVSFASLAVGETSSGSSGSGGRSNQHASAGVLKLLVARVLLGKQCEGRGGISRPPDRFDSVRDGFTAGYHIIFDNFAAYLWHTTV